MMDMREFQEKLEQLMELAAKQEKNLNNEQILESFGLNQLSPQQLQSLYEYLRIQGIRIQGQILPLWISERHWIRRKNRRKRRSL